jgi:lactoylglutathione lyase
LDVTDVEAAFQAAKEKNYNIKETEVKFLPFWENGVKFFNIVGPNNETVEFCQKL